MRTFLLLAVVLGMAGPASAQDCETNCTVVAGQAFLVVTDLTANAVGYRVRVNGSVQALTAAILINEVDFTFVAGLPAGSYAFAIEALTSTWETTTEPQTLTVTAPEPAPLPIGCVLDGTPYPLDAIVTVRLRASLVSGWAGLHAEWQVLSTRPQNKQWVYLTAQCRGAT